MAIPMNSVDFRSITAPILNEAFDGVYELRQDQWKGIFVEKQGTKRKYHEEPVLFGFNQAPEMPEGTPVIYDAGGQLFNKRYIYKVYGLGFAITKVAVEDGEHINLGQTYAKHLAQSLIDTKETLAANVLNRAFNNAYPGGDGVSLINSAHPIANGTFSNILSTPANLSQTSLEQMLIQISNAVDNNGKKITLTPKAIVSGSNYMYQGEVLLNSFLRAGTSNNDINPVKSMGMLKDGHKVMNRITSTTSWFITTDAPVGGFLMMRRKLEKSMEGDFETDSMRYKATERYDLGWTDPRWMFGTQGV